MKTHASSFGICALLAVATGYVLSNILTLLRVRKTGTAGQAMEDIVGFGIAPVWIVVGIVLGLLLLPARRHLTRNQLIVVLSGFLALLIADWFSYWMMRSYMRL